MSVTRATILRVQDFIYGLPQGETTLGLAASELGLTCAQVVEAVDEHHWLYVTKGDGEPIEDWIIGCDGE